MPNIHESKYPARFIQEPNETQLYTPASRKLHSQSVGFHSVYGLMGAMGKVAFFLFLWFWWYPFNPTYDTMIPFSKIDTYGAVRNTHLPVLGAKIGRKNRKLNSRVNSFYRYCAISKDMLS